jgi:hypothetical protein
MNWPAHGMRSGGWIPTREAQRIENKILQRAVIGWRMVGASYKQGRRIPGMVYLDLEGGGWLYYPEGTPLDAALADADDRGFSTVKARKDLDEWVRTGQGATFSLGKGCQ